MIPLFNYCLGCLVAFGAGLFVGWLITSHREFQRAISEPEAAQYHPITTPEELLPMTNPSTIPSLPASHSATAKVDVLATLASVQARQALARSLAEQAVKKAAELKAAAPAITDLSIPANMGPALTPPPVQQQLTAPALDTSTPPTDLTGLLTEVISTQLPGLATTFHALFSGKFQMTEVWAAGVAASKAVSLIVGTGMPMVKGMDAEAVVSVILAWGLDTYAKPNVPFLVYMALRPALLGAVKFLYDAFIKPKLTPTAEAHA